MEQDEPFFLAQYLIELAKAFNRFYYRMPVLQAQEVEWRSLRLVLVEATLKILRKGLGLLGVDCPAEM